MIRAKITGTGMYVPDRVVTNKDLEQLMDTSDEWIRQRSGIEERRYVGAGSAALGPRRAGCAPGDRGRRARARPDRLHHPRHPLARGRLPGHVLLPPGEAGRGDPVLRPARPVQRLPVLAQRGPELREGGPVRARAGGGLRGALDGHRPHDRGPRRGGALRRRRRRRGGGGRRRSRTPQRHPLGRAARRGQVRQEALDRGARLGLPAHAHHPGAARPEAPLPAHGGPAASSSTP